jgi:hypothetical protein|tara:strand:- start:828 stop:986 length:159 start_codon:yes stop_codon:yes gene_type:complete
MLQIRALVSKLTLKIFDVTAFKPGYKGKKTHSLCLKSGPSENPKSLLLLIFG